MVSRFFLLSLRLSHAFGVDALRLHGVLPDMSVGKLALRPRNTQPGQKMATSVIQGAVVHF